MIKNYRAVFLKMGNRGCMVILEWEYDLYNEYSFRPKWVYRGKKLERKKIRVEYFCFQGGDLLPLLAKLAATNI
jgi:hypothetical protein